LTFTHVQATADWASKRRGTRGSRIGQTATGKGAVVSPVEGVWEEALDLNDTAYHKD